MKTNIYVRSGQRSRSFPSSSLWYLHTHVIELFSFTSLNEGLSNPITVLNGESSLLQCLPVEGCRIGLREKEKKRPLSYML